MQLLGLQLVADSDTDPRFGEDVHGRRARSLMPKKQLQLETTDQCFLHFCWVF